MRSIYSQLTLFVIGVAVLLPSVAAAQTSGGYVGAGFSTGPWSSDSIRSGASLSFSNESTATSARSVAASAGIFVSPVVAVGVETEFPERNDITQRYGYTFGQPYLKLARYRDVSIMGVVHLVRPLGRKVSVGVLGGAGTVQENSRERVAYAISPRFATYGPFGPEISSSHWTFGLTGGIEALFPVVRHIDVVPNGRLVWIDRQDITRDAQFHFGISNAMWRFGIGLRVR